MSQIILTGIGDPAQNTRLEEDPRLTVGADDVLVQLEAAPVNPVDFLFANGWYGVQPQLPSTIGCEGVGRVLQVGAAADQTLAGKRVVILPTYEQGLWADTAVVPARNVIVVPEAGDAQQLSMLAINPVTAYRLLKDYVDLKPGDWIGQNLGTSAVARHVIALAKAAGVKTLTIVRRQDAVEELRALGADLVLIEGEDLSDRIAAALGDQQLRLVLDGAASSSTGALATALEYRGTVVIYSSTTGEAPLLPLGNLVFNELSLRGFWLVTWLRNASRTLIEQTFADLADLTVKGVLSVPVEATYALTDYDKAIAHAAQPGRTGKILFTFNGTN